MRKNKSVTSLKAGKVISTKKTNRLAFLIFTVTFSCVMVLGSTYAWFTSADSVTNEFRGTRLAAEIQENFVPNHTWGPGTDTRKEVWVKNTGDTAAFIRVSMEEFLLSFEMEVEKANGEEGTGNVLAIIPKPGTSTIEATNPKTWQANEYYHKKITDEYYKGVTTVPSNLATTGKGYRVGVIADQVARSTSDLKHTMLNFGKVLPAPSASDSNYWLYGDDGYFYYSERVEPNQSTSWLLASTSLARSVPNRLKDSLYQIDINMDAQQSVKETFSDWSHSGNTDPVYLMLKDKVSE